MRLISRALLLSTSILAAQTAQAGPDAFTHLAVENLRVGTSYPSISYDMKFKTGGDLSDEVVVRVDLSQATENQISLLSANDHKRAKDIIETLSANDNEALDIVWCDHLVDKVPSSYHLVDEVGGLTKVAFTPKAKTEDNEKIYPHLKATLTFETTSGKIVELKLRNESPFKPSPIAKVHHLAVTYSCMTLSNGMSVLDAYSAHVKGKALFQSFDEVEEIEFSKYTLTDLQ